MTSEVTKRSEGLIQYQIPDPYRQLMVGAPTPIVNVVHCSGNERPCLVSFEGRPVRFPFGGPIIASESFVPRNYYFT